jgi:hypothetical protein
VKVDRSSGKILHQVVLSPSPFGIAWRVEQQGAFFVVRDDREISAYDLEGLRLWKRMWPTHVAFVGERDGRHISVIPDADHEGVSIALADLATGGFDTVLRLRGSMQFVGAHGTLVGGMLFLATDDRDVYSIDTLRWEVKNRYRMAGSHILRPVATLSGVHAASIERRHDHTATTHVITLDRETGQLVSTQVLPGAAYALAVGSSGLVVDTRRSPWAPVERTAFRPENPSLRLTVSKDVDMHLLPGRAAVATAVPVSLVRDERKRDRRRHELLPAPPEPFQKPASTPKQGLYGLLQLTEARSDVLMRLADTFGGYGKQMRLEQLGITMRDPRERRSTGAGRDPCLLGFAQNRDGDVIATYFYPPGKTGLLPIVLVSGTTREVRWLSDDFDAWFAGVLNNALLYAEEAVMGTLRELALSAEFPRPLANAIPPPWFFEAHATKWTLADAETALTAGDVEGAERMLVSAARTNPAAVKERLATVYEMLGWDHHRSTVVETW